MHVSLMNNSYLNDYCLLKIISLCLVKHIKISMTIIK